MILFVPTWERSGDNIRKIVIEEIEMFKLPFHK